MFTAWDAAGIHYVVLRNYENLPEDIGNDLDILVEAKKIKLAELILNRIIVQHGGLVHNRAEFLPVSFFFHDPETRRQFHIDLFRDLKWRGVDLLSPEKILANSIYYKNIRIPSVPEEAVLNLLTRLIYGGYVREKYKEPIYSVFSTESTDVRKLLSRVLGSLGTTIWTLVIQRNWNEIERLVGAIRRVMVLRAIRHAFTSVRALLLDAKRLCSRWIHSPGLSIVLIGPDGCGKTTLGVELEKRMAGSFYEEFAQYLHWKPRLMKKKAAAANPFGTPCTNPQGQPVRGPVMNVLYFLAHTLEIPPAWLLRVQPHLFRNRLVLIDRYYYDFMVDPRRYRMSISAKWAWFMYKFIPKPDLVFCLNVPPEVTQARKSEVPLEETVRQRQAYEAVTRRLPYGYVINADRPVEQTAVEVKEIILRYLTERHAARMRKRRDAAELFAAQKRFLILTYHKIVKTKNELAGFFDVTEEEFSSQLEKLKKTWPDHIKEAGARNKDLTKLSGGWQFLLTFDDGTEDHYKIATGTLMELGLRGVFFVNTSRLDVPGYLSVAQCREMVRLGHAIESHAHNHLNLTEMSDQEVRTQLRESKIVLEKNGLGLNRLIAFPGGCYDNRVMQIAKEEGFHSARTLEWGYNEGTFFKMESLNITRLTAGVGFSFFISPRMIQIKRILYRSKEVLKKGRLRNVYFRWRRDPGMPNPERKTGTLKRR